MNKNLHRRILALLLVAVMILTQFPAVSAAPGGVRFREVDLQVAPGRSDRLVETSGDTQPVYNPTDTVRVSIVLEKASTLKAGFSTTDIARNEAALNYDAALQREQDTMAKTISRLALKGKELDVVWNITLAGNIISANVPYGSIDAIAAVDGVAQVVLEQQYEPCTAAAETVVPNTYPSASMDGADQLWAAGITGAGSRIAIVDTGTDTAHQSFDNGAYLAALENGAAAKGMSLEAYMESLDLLDEAEITAVLSKLNLHEINPGITARDLYHNEKLAFGYNYVDGNLRITHAYDQQGEHGSHVAGIATANRYIPTDSGYTEAAKAVKMMGVAPDAQLLTMKVFGEGNPYDSDYFAAIEDAIWLGCDAVNLSLGSTAPGSPRNEVYNDLLEMMTETDTVVVMSAGNSGTWSAASLFGYPYADDVVTDTVGAPGSYANALTVASVQNDGTVGYCFEVGGQKAFYSETLDYGNTAMATLDTSADQSGTEYAYVILNGLGYEEDYAGIDVSGKVVIVSRGTLTFAEKANNALSRGAVAVAVYNNEPGFHGMDLTGLRYAAPVVSITEDDGATLREISEDRGTHLAGKLTVYGKATAGIQNSDYYTMSSFSSWGVPGDLSLKPEITAPGGNIYSVWGSNPVTGGGTDQYETMSGTSMAAPQVSGMAALMAEYIRERGLDAQTGMSLRHLTQSLLMSTAQPLLEEASRGNYYSLLSQGAGLARVDLASAADSCILVEGQNDGKVKAELGDDPQRTGVYEFTFTIRNLDGQAKDYALRADLFRQDIFEYQEGTDIWLMDTWTKPLAAEVTFTSSDASIGTGSGFSHDLNGDGATNAADADHLLEYLMGNAGSLAASGDVNGDGTVNTYDAHVLLSRLGQTGGASSVRVPANGSATVTVRMALTNSAREQLEAECKNGTFVEAFVYAESADTSHSIPMLAFYGDWSDPHMFDRGTMMELHYMTTSEAPYLYREIGYYGNTLVIDYGDGNEYYYGGNPILDDQHYLPERNAFSSTNGSRLTEQNFTLIRGAGNARLQVSNADTGEVYMERTLGELYPAYYNSSYGQWENTIQIAKLNWSGTDAAGVPLREGTRVNVTLTAATHYSVSADGKCDFDALGQGSSMTTTMTIDNTAPTALAMDLDQAASGSLTIKATDNEYVAAVALLNAAGTEFLAVESPNQRAKNTEVTVELDISSITGKRFVVAVFDYANNMTAYEVTLDLPEPERAYFTAIDYNTMNYVSVDMAGQTSLIADTGLTALARAAEYVDGYVFVITKDNNLWAASDDDLSAVKYICQLDTAGAYDITDINDMAYSHAVGKLYVQFYAQQNYEATPYLATIDMDDGTLKVVCELPVDVNTMAIDTNGNFYSAGYNSTSLYTYTLADVTGSNPGMTYVGEMGSYYSVDLSSMAWDHNTGKLYWVYPNTLLEINPKTAEPTLLGYHQEVLVGLYTRDDAAGSRFDPVDRVDRMELNLTDTRVPLGNSLTLEATVWPWNASDRSVTWTSSDLSIATVDAKGVVTGLKEGKCTITATSNLDKSIAVQCTIEVFRIDKTLNGLVWDADGKIWLSEFSVEDLSSYTKLSGTDLGHELASATISQNGSIYAASLDVNTMKSELYKLDPVTYQPTLIGSSSDGYVDMAPAPGQPGDSLMAVCGGNVLNVDAVSGDYYNYYYMFSYNLVGLAYAGTEEYKEYGFDTLVDWYFIIDRIGNVYLLGFLEQNGSYYYLENGALAPGGIYTQTGFEMETPYYGSAYYDGEFLYFSAYQASEDNVVLMAIDVAGGSKACYTLGTFEEGVWPVAGLMELDGSAGTNAVLGTERTARPQRQESSEELQGLELPSAAIAGGPQNAAGAVTVQSKAELASDGTVQVDVTLPAAATNGILTVTYDPAALKLTGVEGKTDAFAWTASDGTVKLAFAAASTLSSGTRTATLSFTGVAVTEGTSAITITASEWNNGWNSSVETLQVQLPCPSERFVDVGPGVWYHEPVDYVVSKGYMNGMDGTHFGPDMTMTRAQFVTVLYRMEGQPATTNTGVFDDVPQDYYTNAAYWALETGITTGMDAHHFGPDRQLTRAQLVTFMYRYAKYKGYDISATASLDAYSDAYQVSEFAQVPFSWALTHGIVTGVSADTLVPEGTATRAQAATIFMRLDKKFSN